MKIRRYKAVYMVTLLGIVFAAPGLRAQESQPASKTLSETTKEFLSDPSRTGSLLGTIIAGSAVANPLAPMLGSVAGFLIGKSSAFTIDGNQTARQRSRTRRSLFPEEDQAQHFSEPTGQRQQITDLTFNSTAHESGVAPGIGNLSEHTDHTVILGLPRGTVSGNLPEQSDTSNVSVVATENAATLELQKHSDQSLIPGLSDRTGRLNHLEQTTQHGMTGDAVVEGSSLQKRLANACRNGQITQATSLNCYYFSE